MRDQIWDEANNGLTTLCDNITTMTPELAKAVDAIQKLSYAYHEATNVISSINAKIHHYHKEQERLNNKEDKQKP